MGRPKLSMTAFMVCRVLLTSAILVAFWQSAIIWFWDSCSSGGRGERRANCGLRGVGSREGCGCMENHVALSAQLSMPSTQASVQSC